MKFDELDNSNNFKDPVTGIEYDVLGIEILSEWLAENYNTTGATLELITNKSAEGF